jgi:pyruvate dehydrogenase E2 component (dihydrolipoamide acetyltransferase)
MFKITLPKKLHNLNQALLYQWLRDVEDKIEQNEPICLVQAGQELFEVKSGVSGTLLKILVYPGGIFDGTMPIAILGTRGENVSAAIEKPGASSTVATSETSQIQKEEKPISPSQPGGNSMSSNTNASAASSGSVTPILMPQAGQSMEEGTILSWKVKEGDRIEVGQIIMEIETDKANMEVEAIDAGRVAKIIAKEGDIVEVKQPVAYLAENDADVEAYLTAESPTPTAQEQIKPVQVIEEERTPVPKQTSPTTTTDGRIKASPAARKLAKEKDIDLSNIPSGSGPGGRIISTDLESIESTAIKPKSIPLTKMRKAIAQNLLYSKQNIPHFYTKCTIDAYEFFNLYRKTKEQFKCTVNDFVTAACAKAIRQYAAFRSQYRDNEIVEFPSVNIGIAVGTENGLTVPVLLNVDKLSLKELAEKTRALAENARNGTCENLGQGIFTITNLGMFGVEEFTAIINPPESALLSVGAIRDGVTVVDGNVKPTKLMTMVLSSDHRVIDGVMGAKFMQTLKELLENPKQLLG